MRHKSKIEAKSSCLFLLGIILVSLFTSCFSDNSSTAVTNKKNPDAGLKIRIRSGRTSDAPPLAFRLSLFLQNQISPIDSEPFFTIDTNNFGDFILKKSHLAPLFEEMAAGVPKYASVDSIFGFSLLLEEKDDSLEYKKASLEEVLWYDDKAGVFLDHQKKKIDTLVFSTQSMRHLESWIDAPHNQALLYLLFVPGSPYLAVLDTNNQFDIKLPEARAYGGKILAISAYSTRSVAVFHLDDSIRFDSKKDLRFFGPADSIPIHFNTKDVFRKYGRWPLGLIDPRSP